MSSIMSPLEGPIINKVEKLRANNNNITVKDKLKIVILKICSV